MAIPEDLNSREHQKFIEYGSGTTSVRVTPMYSSLMTTSLATVNVGSGVALGTSTNTLTGLMYKVTQCVGTLSGTPGTIDTKLVDSKGGTIAVLAAQAESSTATYATTVPLTTDMKWIVTATGDPDGTQTAAAGVNVVLNVHYQQ